MILNALIDEILEVEYMEKKVIHVIPKKRFEIVIKNIKDTDGCCGCKYVHDSIEICKLRDCWRAIKPKDAYEDKEEDKK